VGLNLERLARLDPQQRLIAPVERILPGLLSGNAKHGDLRTGTVVDSLSIVGTRTESCSPGGSGMRPICLLGVVLVFGCGSAASPAVVIAPDQATPAPKVVDADILITNVTVIDVAAGKANAGQTVSVKGDRIAAVLPTAEVAGADGAKTIDGSGKFLIPG